MRTGRNAMRSAGIDARNGAPERGKRHCVDLYSPRILPIITGGGLPKRVKISELRFL